MTLKVATWNINSVRLRIDLVTRFLEQWSPDVLCLQETKCPQGQFPSAALRKIGYEYIAEHGQKGYHGVAIVSRLPLNETGNRAFCGKTDCRHVTATIAGIDIHNFYVPAGGDEPDPVINEKFAHKLKFLAEMEDWFPEFARSTRPALVVGDLNIAPLEQDVWSHKELLKIVSHTPIETEGLKRVQTAGNWVDVMRKHVPVDQKLYTWWSYRAKDWEASNRGRRLDHIWATPDLAARSLGIQVVRETRGWPRTSDHVPVIASLDWAA